MVANSRLDKFLFTAESSLQIFSHGLDWEREYRNFLYVYATFFRQRVSQNLQHKDLGFSETE